MLEAYEWITDQELNVATESIQVILISNIGPCTGCKARLQIFYDDLLAAAEQAGSEVPITVESVNNTPEASRNRTRGNQISTTYGYPDAVKTPYVILGPVGKYWLYRLPQLQ